ncbi:MAG: uL30 family ribosomal protein [Candidatus Woesearchaeota archaeon]
MAAPKKPSNGTMIAALLVRGPINIEVGIKRTLHLLRLRRKHTLVVLSDTPEVRGMLQIVKDYITYGEISQETKDALDKSKFKKENYYGMPPPRKGFERKGIKKPYSSGGALGNRRDKMNELIGRML